MAIDAKALFVRDLERQLAETIPAAEMARVLSAVADQLAGYDVTRIDAARPETDDLLEAYLSALEIQGRSPKTIKMYKYTIRRMMKAVKTPTRSITVYHLRQYLAAEKARGISDQTLEDNRQVYSAYFNWLQREGLIEQNPVANLGTIKCKKQIRSIFSEVDIEKMKEACRTLRDRAIIAFLLSTGCRIDEMIKLDRADVDLNSLECTVLGKGNKERTVFLDPVAGMLLRTYLEGRLDGDPALFVGSRVKRRLTAQGVRKMLTILGQDAGVEHVHPHKFRRTLATNLIRHGMPIQEVAAILGHDKLDTTMKYVVLDMTDVKNAYRKYA